MNLSYQLHSGYVLKTVKDLIENVDSPLDLNHIFKSLSLFRIESNISQKQVKPINDSGFTVIDNLLSRGLPTIPSLFLEETLTNKLKIAEKKIHEKTGEISFKLKEKINSRQLDALYSSLFVVDPRIENYKNVITDFTSWEKHSGSDFEELFYKNYLPKYFDNSICQLLESQRTIDSILDYPSGIEKKFIKRLGRLKSDFYKQRVDFSFQFPTSEDRKDGMVIEIDGSQHSADSQKNLDKMRDKVIEECGWSKTLRIGTNEINAIPPKKLEQLKGFLNHPYVEKIKTNYNNPIWNQVFGIEALQLTLTPFGVARIQKTIVHLITQGILNLNSKVWRFAFIERDIPCVDLAIRDLQELISNLFSLEGKKRKLPKIQYKIFTTKEFQKCHLNADVETDSYPIPSKNYKFDIIIDISLLQRAGLTRIDKRFTDKVNAGKVLTIRSSFSKKEPRLIKSAKPISYKIPKEEQPKSMVYFLQNIFRKEKFREGQVNILRRSLKQENVIALLPTGAGKSLTYQLSALLQPGIVLIVDPLKSLMKDQNDNLKAAGLDSTIFINSSIKTPIEREIRTERMVQGYYQFVFISPERLQIPEFRDYLRQMKDTCFTYCVVDEAHCVSEWGHDFRTSYLRLGKNAREYCNTMMKNIPILGLTGTASFDVLADVQRELEINDETAIVAPSKYERDELHFEIIDVGIPEIPEGLKNDQKIKGLVADQKQIALHRYLNELPSKEWEDERTFDTIEEFLDPDLDYKNSGLIFCPHVSWKYGVQNVQSEIANNFEELEERMGIYAGRLSDDDSIDLEMIQNQFKSDELNLLVATKAFGMGIDKPNIRFTIHFNMPQSIESFYQEAGRAGRDKDKSFCGILYSPTKVTEEINGVNEEITIDKSLMLSFFYNSFRGIEKEKRIMWELLNEITFPYRSAIDDLQEITVNLNYSFNLNLKENKGNPVLYVNGDTFGEGYGSIYLKSLIVYPEKKDERKIIDPSESKKLLDEIKSILLEKCPKNETIYNWLSKKEQSNSIPGFEKYLSKMNVGDNPKRVVVGFTNDKVRKITDYLLNFNNSWDESIILKANNYCFTPNDFIKNLGLEYWKKTKNNFEFNKQQTEQISLWFYQIRDQSDSFKAIYRLSVIGIIDDYEVDYRTKLITATISKKNDEDHINLLKNYISKYVSKEETSRVSEQILEFQGKTVIQKCCAKLADFVYSKIASKRFEAINVMESAIQSGLNDGNFEEFVNTYFDSKYTSDLREYLYEYEIEILWSYLNKTTGEPDSINHLRGACDRLLVENPDNPVLLLLRSFSRLLIPQYNKSDAINDFRKGWKIFKDLHNWSRVEYLSNFSKFYEITNEYDSATTEYLDQELLNDHLNWVKGFNKQFLRGFANA